jgi:excisionase family DNA binding protein
MAEQTSAPAGACGPARMTYKVEEAAALLGVNRNTCYDRIKAGEVPSIRLGRRILVPKAALDRMLAGE